MFCPPDYVSAAKLWDDYVRDNFALIYDHATKHYSSPDFRAFSSRGSPIDVCEHLFLTAVSKAGVHIASPEGQIIKLHVRYIDYFANLFQKVFPFDAAWQFAALELSNIESYEPKRVEGSFFSPWESEKSNNTAFKLKYPPLGEGEVPDDRWPYGLSRFHSLPNYYERDNFVVVGQPPPWTAKPDDSYLDGPFIEKFGGWAICLPVETLKRSWDSHVANSLREYSDVIDLPAKRGRPSLVEARQAWEAMGCEKGKLSWEQIARIIENKTGTKPVPKTLRDWRDSFLGEK